MNVTVQDEPDQVVVFMAEKRLDAAIAGEFKDTVRPHVAARGPDVVLDLGAVEFLDSSGLGAVIALKKALPEGRRMRLRGLTPNVALQPGENTITVDNPTETSNVLVWISKLGTLDGQSRTNISEITLRAVAD